MIQAACVGIFARTRKAGFQLSAFLWFDGELRGCAGGAFNAHRRGRDSLGTVTSAASSIVVAAFRLGGTLTVAARSAMPSRIIDAAGRARAPVPVRRHWRTASASDSGARPAAAGTKLRGRVAAVGHGEAGWLRWLQVCSQSPAAAMVAGIMRHHCRASSSHADVSRRSAHLDPLCTPLGLRVGAARPFTSLQTKSSIRINFNT